MYPIRQFGESLSASSYPLLQPLPLRSFSYPLFKLLYLLQLPYGQSHSCRRPASYDVIQATLGNKVILL